ncbi:MAG TPA: formimidoylglutamate deiminase [Woeseiaceae bacterium]|nr:formimidoylglutamate deiminase [Woeseiaceae bacterium]
MNSVHARKALLPTGWADDVRLRIRAGRIVQLVRGDAPGPGDVRVDCLIPGISNSHSHAFQRALAGWTEQRASGAEDNFWTWRERMYEFAAAMNESRLYAVARQAYTEMLLSGYTSVAEFHYLHRDPDSAARDPMFHALSRAADDCGMRLTYVPVLYERAGFDNAQPEGAQTLFAQDLGSFLSHVERARDAAGGRISVGIGAHSIRAVSAESLAEIAAVAKTTGAPMHIHVAEQQREVDQSLASYQRRPVRWLLENFSVDENWCLVHATHIDDEEITALAATEAVVSLCPSTEANLGDGLFPLRRFLTAGGRISIGSDSQITINPFEELRWLEYGQRLRAQARNIAAIDSTYVGRELFERAVAGGAQACGHRMSGITTGAFADFVCLYGGDPMLVAHDDATRIDALVFSGYRLPIERVMVQGEWVVVDGQHVSMDESRAAYRDAVAGLMPAKPLSAGQS